MTLSVRSPIANRSQNDHLRLSTRLSKFAEGPYDKPPCSSASPVPLHIYIVESPHSPTPCHIARTDSTRRPLVARLSPLRIVSFSVFSSTGYRISNFTRDLEHTEFMLHGRNQDPRRETLVTRPLSTECASNTSPGQGLQRVGLGRFAGMRVRSVSSRWRSLDTRRAPSGAARIRHETTLRSMSLLAPPPGDLHSKRFGPLLRCPKRYIPIIHPARCLLCSLRTNTPTPQPHNDSRNPLAGRSSPRRNGTNLEANRKTNKSGGKRERKEPPAPHFPKICHLQLGTGYTASNSPAGIMFAMGINTP